MEGYYDTHQPLEGTFVPVMHLSEDEDEGEITEEEIQAFIASLIEEE